ncbi:hypothetical protein LQE93_11045 [Clostridium sp. NSJ-145]|uniref:hypothetical protein n=1 Tax=Clostridium sp. NSJ-145 TaxID=2897777 RepID=UPI001E2B3753|nr:hypothetical protein [Clostridium sp. NSJ-145]MCD2502316.1 hypothetical protein [Clostridium sp. NSJ-145]
MFQILMYIIIAIIAFSIFKELLPYIIVIGVGLLGIYLLFNHFGLVIKVVGLLIALGIIINIYDNTIGKSKKKALRNEIINTLEVFGMADAEQIAKAIITDTEKVEEEIKVLVSLGMIEAIKLNNDEKEGTYLYKFLSSNNNLKNTNYESEEIVLD